jgi:hypothetical protein
MSYWETEATGRERLLGGRGYWEAEATGRQRLLGDSPL